MALSRVKTWIANEVLRATDLNAEFNNVLNNALSLISPLTGNLNAGLRSITNLLLETQASTQSAATEGRVYFQTTEDQIHVDDGTNIRRVPTVAEVTRGDVIRASANNQWARLALGSAGQVLRSDGTDVAYSTLTIPDTVAAGDTLYASASNTVTALTKGTAGQVFRMNSGATAPAWSSLLSGLSTIQFVRRTADSSAIQSDDSLNNDDTLLLALAANEVMLFIGQFAFSTGATPDIKFSFTTPASAVIRWAPATAYLATDGTTANPSVSITTSGGAFAASGSASNDVSYMIAGIVANSTNAGNLQFQWAQSTSDASNTLIRANSWLLGLRV